MRIKRNILRRSTAVERQHGARVVNWEINSINRTQKKYFYKEAHRWCKRVFVNRVNPEEGD